MPKDPYKVLGVSRYATLEEIKKKYKDLLKVYHPDTPNTGSTAKAQEINEAYQDICEEIEQKQNNSERLEKDLASIKKEKIRIIEFYINEKELLQLDYTLLVDYQKQIVNIVKKTKEMRNSETIEVINSLYQETISKINKLYCQIAKDFCEKNVIPSEFIQNKVKYNCPINKLINQFKEIKKEYKKEQQNKRIEETINKYKSYTGYVVLEEYISSIIKKFAEEVEEKELDEIAMEPLCQEIEALFSRYYKNIEKINTILKEDLTEEEKIEVRELNANVLNVDFDQMYQNWITKRYKPMMIKLYQETRKKATEASLEMLKNNDMEGLFTVNQKEKKMIEVIQKFQKGTLGLEELKTLEKINFQNTPTTEEVISNSEKQLKETEYVKQLQAHIDIEAINKIYDEENGKKL